MSPAPPRPSPARSRAPLLLAALVAAACADSAQHAASAPGAAPAGERAQPVFDAQAAWKQLERIVAFGPRPSGSPANEQLRAWLEAQLASYGLAPKREAFEAETPAGKLAFANVYADLEGAPRAKGEPSPLVILGSHFDTKRMPFEFVGANDGGSSTAVLLELARLLAPERGRRAVTYRFLFLDGEEAVRPLWEGNDNRYGSRQHARALKSSGELARVRAFVLLDMIGDADLKVLQESYSDPRLLDIFQQSARRQKLELHMSGPRMQAQDDHLSFMEVNVPSLDLIDFQYGPNNAYWHTADDVLANCSAQSLGAIGAIVLGGLPALESWAALQPPTEVPR